MTDTEKSAAAGAESDAAAFFLSRQPIVAGERRLIGWELAFSNADGLPLAGVEEASDAYLAAFSAFAKTASWDSLLCGGRAFMPVDRKIIFSDVFADLPRNRFTLGLAPMAEVDPTLNQRLHELHSKFGVRLLFLDYSRRDPREQLLDLADAVQIDAFDSAPDVRSLLIRRAQRRNLQVLASFVERDVDFVRIRDSGFELFAGRSYAEASSDEETQASAEGRILLQLLVEARGDLEIDAVTKQVEANPMLADGLLRLVNSLELARAQKIEGVGQALIMIGAKGLSRWLNLLLFQIGSKHGATGPLFRVAASRARLMETIAASGGAASDPAAKQKGEIAFLVGIMSLVHVLFGTSRKDAISGLTLPPEMSQALLGYEGELGRLLRFAECLDRGDFAEVAEQAAEAGLSAAEVWRHQCDAYDWVMRIV